MLVSLSLLDTLLLMWGLAAQGWQTEPVTEPVPPTSTIVLTKGGLRVRVSVRHIESLEGGRNTPPTRIAFEQLEAAPEP